MNWGMITYQVPLETYPHTYNNQPLMYAALVSQKNYMAIYLTGIYTSEKSRKNFEEAYKSIGKRFDADKSCVRFKKLDHLPLNLIAKTISSIGVEDLIHTVEQVHSPRKSRKK
jgi:hypothetical protein